MPPTASRRTGMSKVSDSSFMLSECSLKTIHFIGCFRYSPQIVISKCPALTKVTLRGCKSVPEDFIAQHQNIVDLDS